MATCLLPFSTSLLGEYEDQEISILVYGSNSIIMASLLYVQWWYVTSRRGRLVNENIDPVIKKAQYRRLVFGIIVYFIAIAISFVYIHLSVFLFAFILVPAFLPNKIMNRITV